jgi:hypothetical protein
MTTIVTINKFKGATSISPAIKRKCIESIDLLRGIVMIIMALSVGVVALALFFLKLFVIQLKFIVREDSVLWFVLTKVFLNACKKTMSQKCSKTCKAIFY